MAFIKSDAQRVGPVGPLVASGVIHLPIIVG